MMAHTLGMFGVVPAAGAAIRRWGTHRVIAGATVTVVAATLVFMSALTADMKPSSLRRCCSGWGGT